MFGINQISWEKFCGFILTVLILWYLSVILLAFFRKRNSRKILFEEDIFSPVTSGALKPISVSSQDFPSELIPIRLSEDIALPASFYEESGMDEGYSIETFSKPNDPELPKILEQVQFQS